MKKLEKLYEAQKNLTDANSIGGEVNNQLQRDNEAFARGEYNIELLGEKLVVSRQLIEKIKKQDRKSRVLFYLTVGFPIFAFLLGNSLKLWKLFK